MSKRARKPKEPSNLKKVEDMETYAEVEVSAFIDRFKTLSTGGIIQAIAGMGKDSDVLQSDE